MEHFHTNDRITREEAYYAHQLNVSLGIFFSHHTVKYFSNFEWYIDIWGYDVRSGFYEVLMIV